jgi:acyl-CoA oxidase
MFELAVRYLGDDEQVKQWLPLITKCKIIGNYSQTELGHGSNVRVSWRHQSILILGA